MKYEITTNAKGSRQMDITDEQLETIRKHALFEGLVDSNGIIDETVVEKLRLNVRALMEAQPGQAELLDLCQNVLFHDNMKAYGLNQLVELYAGWQKDHPEPGKENTAGE